MSSRGLQRSAKAFAALAFAPFVASLTAGVRYAGRAATARRGGVDLEPGVPTPAPTAGLAAAVALDTLVTLPVGLLSSMGSETHYEASSAEVDEALAFYEREGWSTDSDGRHPAPTDTPELRVESGRGLDTARFESGWRPAPGEPGADRWQAFEANRTVTVRMMRHPGGPRPWLIAIHGQGMGRAGDHRMLRVRRVHEELGVNVALPVLPLHGPRGSGYSPPELFVSNVYPVNNVLGATQSVWDVRRLLRWLRADQGATSIGVLGLSLGSYVCSLLSTVERDLACVVALVPEPDLAGSLRNAEPLLPGKRALHRSLYDHRIDELLRPVSPLERDSVVPRHRRFIVAGQADRIASPSGAARLWSHWDEPSILWRPRGHVTTGRSAVYDDHLAHALTTSGVVSTPSTRGEP